MTATRRFAEILPRMRGESAIKPWASQAGEIGNGSSPPFRDVPVVCREGQLRVTGGCHRQVDGTAGLPSVPEMPCAPRQLRLVPLPDIG